jgi:hypothetical protein
MRSLRGLTSLRCVPEIIKIEPVVRREATVVLEAFGVALDMDGEGGFAGAAGQF